MEWLTTIKEAINYMEENLLEIQSSEEVAKHVYISSMYLQKGFQILTGYTIGEYIKKRRLYLAAIELANKDVKVIDIAYKYGYETPESFTKAFSRFHGATPKEIKKDSSLIKPFLPLTVSIIIQGGDNMNFTVGKMNSFKVIGFSRLFEGETSMREIPKYWDEVIEKYGQGMIQGLEPTNTIEQAMINNRIGEFGICIDNIGEPGRFKYMIAGKYLGGEVPEGMEVVEIPESNWAKFNCIGPIPQALQSMTRQIWSEWLPGNQTYELAGDINIEWYSPNGNTTDHDYQTAIWLPVKEK